ncbi:patatin-like phospholipase family protein [Megalodesulfovibrio paquesii]
MSAPPGPPVSSVSPGRRPASPAALRLSLAALLCLGCVACGSLKVRAPIPEQALDQLSLNQTRVMATRHDPGFSGVRGWGDVLSPDLQHSIAKSVVQNREWHARQGTPLPGDIDILALSGGGPDGAFGAGVLCGWTDAGTRPEFRVVTGVSTGALSAPFVFLGPDYDAPLRELYTTLKTKDIFFLKGLYRIVFGDSVTDTTPLQHILRTWVNEEMLAKIAVEHARGRRLFIATTNLDAQRNVVWDMGAIASSRHPKALELFHKVLLASSAIPVVFPPQYIPVESQGEFYDEMHVDGGVISQFIVYDGYLNPRRMAEEMGQMDNYQAMHKHVHILINNKIGPVGEPVKPRLAPIASRSISTLIKSQAKGALAYAYLLAKRDDMDMRYMAIPEEFEAQASEPFDPVAMRKTFDLGYAIGRNQTGWQELPPGYNN